MLGISLPMSRVMLFACIVLGSCVFSNNLARGADIDLSKAVVLTRYRLSRSETRSVQMLVEEVQKRTLIRWEVVHEWPAASLPIIEIAPASALPVFAPGGVPDPQKPRPAEGFSLSCRRESAPPMPGKSAVPSVSVIGNDAGGML